MSLEGRSMMSFRRQALCDQLHQRPQLLHSFQSFEVSIESVLLFLLPILVRGVDVRKRMCSVFEDFQQENPKHPNFRFLVEHKAVLDRSLVVLRRQSSPVEGEHSSRLVNRIPTSIQLIDLSSVRHQSSKSEIAQEHSSSLIDQNVPTGQVPMQDVEIDQVLKCLTDISQDLQENPQRNPIVLVAQICLQIPIAN